MCKHCEQSGHNRRDFLKLLASCVSAATAIHVCRNRFQRSQ